LALLHATAVVGMSASAAAAAAAAAAASGVYVGFLVDAGVSLDASAEKSEKYLGSCSAVNQKGCLPVRRYQARPRRAAHRLAQGSPVGTKTRSLVALLVVVVDVAGTLRSADAYPAECLEECTAVLVAETLFLAHHAVAYEHIVAGTACYPVSDAWYSASEVAVVQPGWLELQSFQGSTAGLAR
jgi:hypothetical protein